MNENERAAWDCRYREGTHSSLTPDPFMVSAYDEFIAPAFPRGGNALDLAGGVGRHAIWLAEHGWQVTLVDISPEGLAQATWEAGERGVSIACHEADLAIWPLPASAFDLILNFFYLERSLFAPIEGALKPGGILLFRTYTREQLKLSGGPTHPMHLLETNELLRAFLSMRVLHYRETFREKAIAELVAQKP